MYRKGRNNDPLWGSPPIWAIVLYTIWLGIIVLRTAFVSYVVQSIIGLWWVSLVGTIPAFCLTMAALPMFGTRYSRPGTIVVVFILFLIDFAAGFGFFYIFDSTTRFMITPILFPWDNPFFVKSIIASLAIILSLFSVLYQLFLMSLFRIKQNLK